MTRRQHDVCRVILSQHFGDTASKVGKCLLQKTPCPLQLLSSDSKIDVEQVKKILCILIHQNIVTFDQNKKGFIEYSINKQEILNRQRYPKYIYCAKTLYGDAAELLLEEVLQRGQVQMHDVVSVVLQRFNEALETSGKPTIPESYVIEKFTSLVKTHFLQRCVEPIRNDADKVIAMESNVEDEILYKIPDMKRKRKRSSDDSEPPNKRSRSDKQSQEPNEDNDKVYWKVNCDRFHQHIRDQVLISAISTKIDKRAGEVLRTILRVSEVKTAGMATVTAPISITEIFHALPKDTMTRTMLETYLSLLADDSTNFVSKVGDHGGGMFSVNIYEALCQLAKAHIESVVQERFGSKCLRIFRVLILKKHLEQKQIEDFVMISAKEAKDLLYTLFSENFITTTEISKTPDHAPSRTFYLFTVNIQQVARMILDRSYKALYNAMLRKDTEITEHRRLLEKQERVDAITASLDRDGADPEQKEEVLQTITPPERELITKVKQTIQMLDQSEIQICEGIFVLEIRLLEKQERVDAITASLDRDGADPEQKEEVLQTITPPERELITKVKQTIQMLDQSEIQICEGIFVLEMYLLYYTQRQIDK